MNNFTGSFVKKVFWGLFCVLFFLGSANSALCAPKKPKKEKNNTTAVAETPTAAAESLSAEDVDVYAEGAYTTGEDGDLAVYIYADIKVGNLVSYGVKLKYDATKLNDADHPVSPPVAEKNEDVWYMGSADNKKPYMDPDTSTSGEIIFIGGKLDEASPTAGVTGTRKLLGKVTFSRTSGTKSADPGANPETYFGITLELGRPDPFDNFVSTDGTVKDDSVAFTTLIRERGDANADGIIDFQDMLSVQYYTQNGGPDHVYKNCNGDVVIDFQDMLCIQNKTQN